MNKHFSLGFCVALLGLSACTTDIDTNKMSTDIAYGTSLVIPVGTAHTTVSKLLDFINTDAILQDSALNTCMLWTCDTIRINTENVSASDFTKSLISSSTMHVARKLNLDLPAGTSYTLPARDEGYSFSDVNEVLDFDYNHYKADGTVDQRIDSIDVTQAELHVVIEANDLELSEINYLRIDIDFPTVPSLESKHYIVTQTPCSIDDKVYDFQVHFKGDSTKVGMVVTYTFVSDGTMRLTDASQITLNTQFRFVDYNRVWGYFGRDEVITSDDIIQEIPTRFFEGEAFQGNKLLFNNPRVRFDIESNVGFPMDFTVLTMKAIDAEGTTVEAEFMEDGRPSPSCVIPLRKPQNECDTSLNTRIFDNVDGHTERLFEITPKQFVYTFQVQRTELTSPEGSWDWQHYLCNPPRINMYVMAEVPFQFRQKSYYQYSDTLACDIETLTGTHGFPNEISVEQLNLSFRYTNKLPVKARAHVVMLDSLDVPVYTSAEFPLNAAPVDAEGRTTGTTDGEFRMEFTGDDIATIWAAKQAVIIVQVDAQDPGNDMIYFSLDDELTVHVALFVKGKLQTDLDTISNIFNK